MRIKTGFVLLIEFLLFGHGRIFAQPPIRANFCDLFGSEDYNGAVVETEGILFIPATTKEIAESSEKYFFATACNNRDYFALADFSAVGSLTPISRERNKALNKTGPRLYLVRFEGRISITLPPKFGHLGFFRAKFEIKEIKSVTAITDLKNGPKTEALAPVMEASSELNVIHSELMLSMYRSRSKPTELKALITNQSVISINEEIISGEDFLKATFIENDGHLEHKVTNITQSGRVWKVKGRIVNHLKGDLIRKMEYENEYFRQEDSSWRLRVLRASIS